MDSEKEIKRLEALHSLNILDTDQEIEFDHLAQLASNICETPVSLIMLIDSNRQWFKAKVGTEVQETERGISFCTHAIESELYWQLHRSLKFKV